jgi:hypothetical protein
VIFDVNRNWLTKSNYVISQNDSEWFIIDFGTYDNEKNPEYKKFQ